MQMDLKTNLWRLNLNVPQVRGGVEFYPSALEKGIRSEKALKLSLAKMYIQGVSTKKRGLYGLKMITSDDHTGLRAARESVFSGVPWQRCQVHLQRNAVPYVPKISMRKKVANDIRNIFNAPDLLEAERLLEMSVEKYKDTASRLSSWMEANIPEGLTVFSLPENQRKKLRSTNMVERLNKEIKRRTRVATLFPNEASLLRLVSSILVEISEEWETGKRYLPMEE